jgi:hypothetical protein
MSQETTELLALLDKAKALVNQAMTASADRQIEIRAEFDGIMRDIDKIRLRYKN